MVVGGDAELLVSRSLLVMNLVTAGLMPVLKKHSLATDRPPAWYCHYGACMCCVLQLLKDVRYPLPWRSLRLLAQCARATT